MRHTVYTILCLLLILSCNNRPHQERESIEEVSQNIPESPPVFVGTYTRPEGHVLGKAEGIYRLQRHPKSGKLIQRSVIGDIINPSYLTFSPDGKYLYAVSEIGGGQDTTGYVYAYAVTEDEVQMINRRPSHGIAPCHLAIHPSGKYLFVANYGGGISMYPLERGGRLGEAVYKEKFSGQGPHERQDASHPHSVTISPDGRFAYIADLGTDRILIFNIHLEEGRLEAATSPYAQLAPGAGPRHLAFHPNGQLIYSINELNSTITAFQYDRTDGHLQALQTVSTLPGSYTGENHCAEISLTPNGNYLYGSNRGHNSLAIFSVDANTGELNSIGYQPTLGDAPRHFTIDDRGRFLYVANQNTDNIVQFEIDSTRGDLLYQETFQIPTPVCIQLPPRPAPS